MMATSGHKDVYYITPCCEQSPMVTGGFFSQVADDADLWHYNDVITGPMSSQITSLTIIYSTVYSGVGQRKQQRSASLAFVLGIHWWPMNSPHKGPVTQKMFPFDDVTMDAFFVDSPPQKPLKQREELVLISDGITLIWRPYYHPRLAY